MSFCVARKGIVEWKEPMKKTLILPNNIKEEETETSNVLSLHPELSIITGGRPPDGSDYLSKFPVGTIFLVKPNTRNYDKPFLACWQVYQQLPKSTFIGTSMTNGQEETAWVIPEVFCKAMLLHEIIHIPEVEG